MAGENTAIYMCTHVHMYTCIYIFNLTFQGKDTCVTRHNDVYIHVHILMRDEKEGRKKEARSCILIGHFS